MKLNSKIFCDYLNKNFQFEKKPKIAVAVSGGPDSMALIHLLNIWSKKNKANIIALIVNHNLRSESKLESKKTSLEINNMKIENYILNVSLEKINKKNMKEARNNRYNKLLNFCLKNKILYLFVAHHKDDNLETFLIRKISGSEISGLQGMTEFSINRKICILRPLLGYNKKSIYEYNKKNNINYIEDPSNTNSNFTRASIRKYLKKRKNAQRSLHKDYSDTLNIIPKYNLMIWELFNKNIEFANKNIISINYDKFLKIDQIILEKFVLIIYKFFYGNTFNLRLSKLKILLDSIQDNNFKVFNIKSLIVRRYGKNIIFYPK